MSKVIKSDEIQQVANSGGKIVRSKRASRGDGLMKTLTLSGRALKRAQKKSKV